MEAPAVRLPEAGEVPDQPHEQERAVDEQPLEGAEAELDHHREARGLHAERRSLLERGKVHALARERLGCEPEAEVVCGRERRSEGGLVVEGDQPEDDGQAAQSGHARGGAHAREHQRQREDDQDRARVIDGDRRAQERPRDQAAGPAGRALAGGAQEREDRVPRQTVRERLARIHGVVVQGHAAQPDRERDHDGVCFLEAMRGQPPVQPEQE